MQKIKKDLVENFQQYSTLLVSGFMIVCLTAVIAPDATAKVACGMLGAIGAIILFKVWLEK